MARRLQLSLLAVVALALVVPISASGAVPLPKSIASTGDSLTRAAGTGFLPWTDNPAGSWSTGTDAFVNSHYLRLLALNPKIRGKSYNDARSGAKMAELATQMDKVIAQRADYVTVEMGGNDVCASNEVSMTSVADYRAQFQRAWSGSPPPFRRSGSRAPAVGGKHPPSLGPVPRGPRGPGRVVHVRGLPDHARQPDLDGDDRCRATGARPPADPRLQHGPGAGVRGLPAQLLGTTVARHSTPS